MFKYQKLEQKLVSLEGDRPSAITENIDKEEIEEVKDESYQMEVEHSEKQNKDIEQKSSSLEGDRPSAITENINKEEREKKVISKEERDNKVSEALEQAESELGTSAQKKLLQEKAAELLNKWNVPNKSKKIGNWSWTKVRDYFNK